MPETRLAGDLGAVSLAGLFQLLESESTTGRLELSRGRFDLFNGYLAKCEYGSLRGSQAAIEAMIRAAGQFRFVDVDVSASQPVAPTMALVMESCRVLDSLERIGSAHLARSEEWSVRVGDLDRRLFIRALDGSVPLAPLMIERELPIVTSLPWIEELLASGQLVRVGMTEVSVLDLLRRTAQGARSTSVAEPAASPIVSESPDAAGDATFDELIFEARSHARKRRYDLAEKSLLTALELRPGHRIAAQNLSRIRRLMANA